ncbi:1564_t:CDS:2, partial [Paraglomus occultum]
IARQGFQLYADIEFDSVERIKVDENNKVARTPENQGSSSKYIPTNDSDLSNESEDILVNVIVRK